MGKIFILSFIAVTALTAYILFNVFSDGTAPKLADQYWGPTLKNLPKDDPSIRPFKIAVSDKIIQELKQRLKIELDGGRFTVPLEEVGFNYGFNNEFLRKVGQHWLDKYDWRTREKLLNKYPHFKTKISGLDLHFQHVKSSQTGKFKMTKPLLLLHGWPGSIVEFQKIIPLLTDPAESDINFEVGFINYI